MTGPFGGALGSPLGGPFDDGSEFAAGGTAPIILGVPVILGSGEVGTEHTVGGFVVTGNPAPQVGYSWRISGIERGTAPSYIPTESDAVGVASGYSSGYSSAYRGSPNLTCRITATNPSGAATPVETEDVEVVRSRVGLLSAQVDQPRGKTGDALTVSYTSTGAEEAVFYQWLHDGLPISGATSASRVTDDAGGYTCAVTATRSGASQTITTDEVRIVHQQIAGTIAATGATSASGTFNAATREITGQAFLIFIDYEGPAPVSIAAGGLTMTAFADGTVITGSGKTLTLVDGDLQGTSRQYILTLDGLTGTKDCAFAIDTGTAFTFLKVHAWQIADYDLTRASAAFSAPGSASTLTLPVLKPAGGAVFAMANRMPSISAPPPGWSTTFAFDHTTSGNDVISGYAYGNAAFQGDLTFAQTIPSSGQTAMALALPPIGEVFPEMVAIPTITGGTAPVVGTPITLNIAAVSVGTERVLVQVYRDTDPRVVVMESTEYEVGSGAPAPTYTPSAADATFRLLQGQTPAAGTQTGFEVFSAVTGVVAAAATITPPALLASNKFTFAGTSEANGGIVVSSGVEIQRADTTVKAGITQPSGWKIALLRSLQSGLTRTSTHPDMQSITLLADLGVTYDGSIDALWRSNGGAAHGVRQYLYVWWKHTATGQVFEAVAPDVAIGAPYSFLADTGEVEPPIDTSEPAPNQTLTAATAAAVVTALNARVGLAPHSSNWIIDLPTGNYGGLNISNMVLPGPTILRSANQNYGAYFTSVVMQLTQNVIFRLVEVSVENRTATYASNGQATGDVVNMKGHANCGFEWCDIDCGPNVKRTATGRTGVGWMEHIMFGIDSNPYDSTHPSSGIRLVGNWIHGGASHMAQLGNTAGGLIEGNVYENTCGDDMQCGGMSGVTVKDNWGARQKFPSRNEDYWIHTDFFQAYAAGGASVNNRYIGNVAIKGDWNAVPGGGWTSIPAQGLFGAATVIKDTLWDNNIIITNTPNALYYTEAGQTGNTMTNNTSLRLTDDQAFNSIAALCQVNGAATRSGNVQCAQAGQTGMGPGGLNIVMITGAGGVQPHNYSAVHNYHVDVRMASSFYECRPIEGKETHWGYSGTKVGAWKRWQEVIVQGKYPKKGRAATAWKRQYDPRNQITS